MPNGTMLNFTMNCQEKVDSLYFKMKDHNDDLYRTVIIENL